MKIVFWVSGDDVPVGLVQALAVPQMQVVLDPADLATAGGIDQAVAAAVLSIGDYVANKLKANLLRHGAA